jgi:amidase
MDQQQVLQGREAWETAQDWIDQVNPRFSFEVTERYLTARAYTDAEVDDARQLRQTIMTRMDTVLADRSVICLPTTPTPAPPVGERISARRELRSRMSTLTCLGGTTGCPQLNLPLAKVDGLPCSLSLFGARGADEQLMALAQEVTAKVQRR